MDTQWIVLNLGIDWADIIKCLCVTLVLFHFLFCSKLDEQTCVNGVINNGFTNSSRDRKNNIVTLVTRLAENLAILWPKTGHFGPKYSLEKNNSFFIP